MITSLVINNLDLEITGCLNPQIMGRFTVDKLEAVR